MTTDTIEIKDGLINAKIRIIAIIYTSKVLFIRHLNF